MLYETVKVPDIKVGDWVQQDGWVLERDRSNSAFYWEVQKVEDGGITILEHTEASHGSPNPVSGHHALRYSRGSGIWYRLIKELPYDPEQQGDRDDDI